MHPHLSYHKNQTGACASYKNSSQSKRRTGLAGRRDEPWERRICTTNHASRQTSAVSTIPLITWTKNQPLQCRSQSDSIVALAQSPCLLYLVGRRLVLKDGAEVYGYLKQPSTCVIFGQFEVGILHEGRTSPEAFGGDGRRSVGSGFAEFAWVGNYLALSYRIEILTLSASCEIDYNGGK